MNLVDALVLKDLKGVGDVTVTELLKFSQREAISSLEELAKVDIKKLSLRTIPDALKTFFSKKDYSRERQDLASKLEGWKRQGVEVIHIGSHLYPRHLLQVKAPPPFLYCRGKVELLQHTLAIAVVGTRQNTPKGSIIAARTVEAFYKRGFAIVSGLAIGIDAIAHRAALDCGTPTIAVLVDVLNISPSINGNLAEEILLKGGLLVAENPPGTPIIAAYFAKRDRIQAGLSTAVFAIETSIDGGTMHAVNAAEMMKRPVFVPDAIAAKYQDLSLKAIEGTQYLVRTLKARAYSVDSYDSICKELVEISKQFESEPDTFKQTGLLI